MIKRNSTAKKVLTNSQLQLKPLLEEFNNTHFLVGGTAIALHLGHRESIDFDLFTMKSQGTGKQLLERIENSGMKKYINPELSSKFWLSDNLQEDITLFFDIDSQIVKVQILNFNRDALGRKYYLQSNKNICGINTLNLDKLGALKVYALMYRKKWKDLVDLYFILKQNQKTLEDLFDTATQIFQNAFDGKYTAQNILEAEENFDKTETINYLIPNPPSDKEIITFLQKEIKNLYS